MGDSTMLPFTFITTTYKFALSLINSIYRLKTPATIGRNSSLKSPLVEQKLQQSPRISSLTKRLNSPCKTRDSVPKVRLSELFENSSLLFYNSFVYKLLFGQLRLKTVQS